MLIVMGLIDLCRVCRMITCSFYIDAFLTKVLYFCFLFYVSLCIFLTINHLKKKIRRQTECLSPTKWYFWLQNFSEFKFALPDKAYPLGTYHFFLPACPSQTRIILLCTYSCIPLSFSLSGLCLACTPVQSGWVVGFWGLLSY